jgi:hypothetical protein
LDIEEVVGPAPRAIRLEAEDCGFSTVKIEEELLRERRLVMADKDQYEMAFVSLAKWVRKAIGHHLQLSEKFNYKEWTNGLGILAIFDRAFPNEIDFYDAKEKNVPEDTWKIARDAWKAHGLDLLIAPGFETAVSEPVLMMQLSEIFAFLEAHKKATELVAWRTGMIQTELSKGITRISAEFHVDYYTHFGEQIVVVGDEPELGGGDVERAVPLEYGADGSWQTIVELHVPSSGKLKSKYRYIVVGTDGSTIDAEDEGAHEFDFQRLPHEQRVVFDDAFHTKAILGDYLKSINFEGEREKEVFLRPMQTSPSDGVQMDVTVFAPTVKPDEELKLVFEDESFEADGNGGPCNWFFSFMVYEWPPSYHFATVKKDGDGEITGEEEEVRTPRVTLEKGQNIIRVDHWIVKPHGC